MTLNCWQTKERGAYSGAYDKESSISVIRWNDNSVVTETEV